MKQVDEMPTSGQFVAVWEEDSGLFSVTMLIDGGDFYAFDHGCELFDYDLGQAIEIPPFAKYFIAD